MHKLNFNGKTNYTARCAHTLILSKIYQIVEKLLSKETRRFCAGLRLTSLNTVHRQTNTTASIDQGIPSTNIMNVSPPPKLRQNTTRLVDLYLQGLSRVTDLYTHSTGIINSLLMHQCFSMWKLRS